MEGIKIVIIKGIQSSSKINKVLDKLKAEDIDLRILRADISKGTVEFVATKNISKLQILTTISNGQLWSNLITELEGLEKEVNLFTSRDTIINSDLRGINHGGNLGVALDAGNIFNKIENEEEAKSLLQSIISIIMVITLHVNRT